MNIRNQNQRNENNISSNWLRDKREEEKWMNFLQTLKMPDTNLNISNFENDDENESDFILDLDMNNNNNTNNTSAINIAEENQLRLQYPTVFLSKLHCSRIRNLCNLQFQLLFQIKHMCIDKQQFTDEYQSCDQMLDELRNIRNQAKKSFQITKHQQNMNSNSRMDETLVGIPYRIPGKPFYPITRHLKQKYIESYHERHTNSAINGAEIDMNLDIYPSSLSSMFDIQGMDEYFKFNVPIERSLKQNIKYFLTFHYPQQMRKNTHLILDAKYLPKKAIILKKSKTNIEQKKQKKRNYTPHFTHMEVKLLEMGLRLYGKQIAPKTKQSQMTGVLLPDWKQIQERFLPHKSLTFVKYKLRYLRKMWKKNHRNRNSIRKKNRNENFYHSLSECQRRTLPMNETEEKRFLKAVEMHGEKQWLKISKEIFHGKWDRSQLRKIYYRKLNKKQNEQKSEHLISAEEDIDVHMNETNANFNINGNPKGITDAFFENLEFCEYSNTDNGCVIDFPHFTFEEENEIISDERKLEKLRVHIRRLMNIRNTTDISYFSAGIAPVSISESEQCNTDDDGTDNNWKSVLDCFSNEQLSHIIDDTFSK